MKGSSELTPILSIIIPVYNVEGYLDRCVNSIISQEYTSCEILLVNDGSTDDSGVICNRWATECECVRTFHKSNGGQSSARNLGLENARGQYIWFVDSDDYLMPNTLGKVVSSALENSAEVLYFSYKTYNGEYLSEYPIGRYYPGVFLGAEIYRKQLASCSVCTMLSLRSLWIEHNLRFVEGIIFEDLEITPRLLKFVSRACFLPQELAPYVYFLRPNSTTKQTDLERKQKQIDFFFEVEKSWRHFFDLDTPREESYDMIVVKVGTNILHRGLLNFIRRSELPLSLKIKLYYKFNKKGVFSIFYNGFFRCDIAQRNFFPSLFWNTVGRSSFIFSVFSLFEFLKSRIRQISTFSN